MKDASNERIKQEILKLAKFMEKEERGFIFAPLPQEKGNHKTFLAVQPNGECSYEDFIKSFWAGMTAIVHNMRTQVPEDLLSDFKKGYKAFLVTTLKELNMGIVMWEG